ncbi:MAG: ribonuclease HI family protein [Candidatus Sumerlaeia bacterium]|nr:ribonuclease HI family protein [Candidatus Sumerlaeia bacterium]
MPKPQSDLSVRLERLLADRDRRARPSAILRAIESAAVDLSEHAQENLSDLIEWLIEAEALAQAGTLGDVTARVEARATAPRKTAAHAPASDRESPRARVKAKGADLIGPPNPGEYPVVKVFIDGGARGNPGPAAIGIVMVDDGDETIWTHAEVIGEATNNIAEYTALVRALTEAKRLRVMRLEVCSDSELVVNQILGRYKMKNEGLRPLWEEAQSLSRDFERFRIRHIPRSQNRVADRLVNQALDEN